MSVGMMQAEEIKNKKRDRFHSYVPKMVQIYSIPE